MPKSTASEPGNGAGVYRRRNDTGEVASIIIILHRRIAGSWTERVDFTGRQHPSNKLNKSICLLAAASIVWTAGALAQDRPTLKDATAVRLSNYGAPSKLFEGKEAKEIIGELEDLRGKRWRQADLKMRCYATAQLLNGTKTITYFRIRPEYVVERPQDQKVPTYNMQITEADLPKLRKLLADVPPSKSCE